MKFFFGLGLLFCTFSLYAQEAPAVNETPCFETENIKDYETKKAMQDWTNGVFGLKPHKANYLLPIGVGRGQYKVYNPADSYKNIEAELQVSLKFNVGNNLFGLHESYNLAYTHTAFWQIYSSSSPFRETNYNPEFFVTFPIEDASFVHLHAVTFGLAHISNGQGNIEEVQIPSSLKTNPDLTPYLRNRSRSVNYIYADAQMQYDTILFKTRVWIPYFGSDLSDNPDIMDYTGYTSFGLKYFAGKNLYTVDTRFNFFTQKGSFTSTYSYPVYDGIFFYAKFFTGYGESLIDYNNYVTKLSLGFSFSR